MLDRTSGGEGFALKVERFFERFSSLVPLLTFCPNLENILIFDPLTDRDSWLLELGLEWLPISADIVPSKYWLSSLIFFEF